MIAEVLRCTHGKPLSIRCHICNKQKAAKVQTLPALAKAALAKAATARKLSPSGCRHLGDLTGGTIPRAGHQGVSLKLYECEVHGQCVIGGGKQGDVACCCSCPDKASWPPPRETILSSKALAPVDDGHHFNASIIDYQGRRLLAYRGGRKGGHIFVAALDSKNRPGHSQRLYLSHPLAAHGREDPRLFLHNGRLHIGFTGAGGEKQPASCLYARLTDGLQVEQVFYPQYEKRQEWEKNWTWFEWGGELFAEYTISPHVILHVVNDQAREFARETWQPRWSGGLLRGGASPVLVGDEFYHFFHGVIGEGKGRVYSIGVYTFAAEPPFRPTRCTRDPILWANPRTKPADFWCDCVFPAGAILDGDKWTVSAGIHDTRIGLYEFDAKAIERALVKV